MKTQESFSTGIEKVAIPKDLFIEHENLKFCNATKELNDAVINQKRIWITKSVCIIVMYKCHYRTLV